MLWTLEDDETWLNDVKWARAKFEAMYALRDRTNQKLFTKVVGTKMEYWFAFETEEEAALFKLTHM
jgi:hypothetical protein